MCCIQEVTEGLLRLQHWGVVEHHNAMVFDLEVAESPDENEEPKVLDKFIFIYYYYWQWFNILNLLERKMFCI